MSRHPWREVESAQLFEGRGGLLGGVTERRARWWDMVMKGCGHRQERAARYGPHQDGWPRQRGGTQHLHRTDVLPAPKRVRCEQCPEEGGDD